MNKFLLIMLILLFGITGCSNSDSNETNNINNEPIETINQGEENTTNNETTQNQEQNQTNDYNQTLPDNNEGEQAQLEEVFTEYVDYIGTIATSINGTVQELQSMDQKFFEENPEKGIDFFYDLIADYKGYIKVIEDLEFNSNQDINYLNGLFIEGLEENIKYLELSINALKTNSINEDQFVKQSEIIQEKFDTYGIEFERIAQKAGYGD